MRPRRLLTEDIARDVVQLTAFCEGGGRVTRYKLVAANRRAILCNIVNLKRRRASWCELGVCLRSYHSASAFRHGVYLGGQNWRQYDGEQLFWIKRHGSVGESLS
jgi:hypothetical protein